MKSPSKAAPYFSGYPLKAITESTKDINLQPYLEALIAGQSREANRAKILAITQAAPVALHAKTINPPVHYSQGSAVMTEPSGNDWFNNYE